MIKKLLLSLGICIWLAMPALSADNISTLGTAGADYTTFEDWEEATDYDLVTAEVREILVCYDDFGMYIATNVMTFSGATTNADYYRMITVAEAKRHDLIKDNGFVVRGSTFTGKNGGALDVRENYFVIEYVAIKGFGSDDLYDYGCAIGVYNTEVTIRYCYIYDPFGPPGNYYYSVGIRVGTSNNHNVYLYGNTMHDFNDYRGRGITVNGNDPNVYIYNNTIINMAKNYNYGQGMSIYRDCVVYNNIIVDCFTIDISTNGETLVIDYNIVSDDSAIGVNSYKNIPPTDIFVSSTTNLHLKAASFAIDKGTDGVSHLVTEDFEGDSRPDGSDWDIGADKYTAPAVYTDILTNPNVDTDNGTDDIYHGNAPGSYAYATLAYAISQQDRNITGEVGNTTFTCVGVAADTSNFSINGWTTDSSHRVVLVGNNFTGTWNTNYYRLETTDSTSISILENYVDIFNLQIKSIRATPRDNDGININSNNTGIINIINSIITSGGDNGGQGIQQSLGFGNPVVNIKNCVVYGFNRSGGIGAGIDNSFSGTTMNIYNTTVYGMIESSHRGISRGDGTVNVINCLVFNNTDDFNGTITMTYCASDDDHTGDSVTNFVITQSASDYAALVSSAPIGDFSLTDDSSELYNTGVDLSGTLDYDIGGTSRPQHEDYDIGAFELYVEPPPTPDTYYVGYGAIDNSGDGTSTSTAKQNIGDGIDLLSLGDILIIGDGIYNSDDDRMDDIPSGSEATPTIIRAENNFQAILSSIACLGSNTAADEAVINLYKKEWVTIQGFLLKDFHGGGQYALSAITISYSTNCVIQNVGIRDGVDHEGEYGGGLSLDNSNNCLIEDVFICGNARYSIRVSGGKDEGSYNNVLRRVVVRWDYCMTAQPRAGITIYGGDSGDPPNEHIYLQNCIVLDGNDGTDNFTGGFSSPHETTNTDRYGCISLNNYHGYGYHMSEDVLSSTITAHHSITWDDESNFYYKNLTSSTQISGLYNCTLSSNSIVGTADNLIEVSSCVFVDGADYSNVTIISSATAVNGDFNDILHSPVANKGATIDYLMGTTGAKYGDSGWNTLTAVEFSEFPNQEVMQALFAEGSDMNPRGAVVPAVSVSTRGFAGYDADTDQPLYEYLYEYLGAEYGEEAVEIEGWIPILPSIFLGIQ